MTVSSEGALGVPGAELYYRTRGSGPLLLLIQGGGGDAEGTDPIAEHLHRAHTVVTYDRRGLSRSTLDDPDEVPSIGTHADDVHRLLASLTDEAVPVFGTSFGAFIGLELLTSHPERVSLLVAHEPPMRQLLSDAALARHQATMDSAKDQAEAFRLAGMDFQDREPGVEFGPVSERQRANDLFFRLRDIPALDTHVLDTGKLLAERARILPAVGSTSRAAFAGRCTEQLAALLDTEMVTFPGSHVGLSTHPRAFAAGLLQVLADLAFTRPR
jgi:pimeloyl-ACP methyl ester carboxylesterase